MLQFLNNLGQPFVFFNYIEIDHFKLTFWKGSIINAVPSKIVDHPKEDHNEQEFKCLIIGGILDQLEKSSKTREASYKCSTIKYKQSTIKDQKSNYGIPLDLQKNSSKFREILWAIHN